MSNFPKKPWYKVLYLQVLIAVAMTPLPKLVGSVFGFYQAQAGEKRAFGG